MVVTLFVTTACGSLSDEDSVWNRQRDVVVENDTDNVASEVSFTPGTFDAISDVRGYGGPVSVLVTIDADGAISDIDVTEHRESEGFYQQAFDNLIPLILDLQSVDIDLNTVDAISGATTSAAALLDAIENALDQAGGTPNNAATFTPGTFEAISDVRGYGGTVSVLVTIDADGAISNIDVTEHRESEGFYQQAFDNLIPLILDLQSVDIDLDTVDAISGATTSATALLDAVRNALNDAE